MIFANTNKMKRALLEDWMDKIPPGADREFVLSIQDVKADRITLPQYNRLVRLFNKYICVPAATPAWKYDGSSRG